MTSGRRVQTKAAWFFGFVWGFFCVRVLVWEDLVLFYCNPEMCKWVTGEMNLQRCGSALGQFVSWELWLHYTEIPL